MALRSNFAEAYQNIGDALRKLGRPGEAVSHYEKALALRPEWAEAEDGLGSALQDLSRPDDALQHFQKAISLRPDFANAYSNRGYALRTLGKLEEANAAFETAIALEPRRPDFTDYSANRELFSRAIPMLRPWKRSRPKATRSLMSREQNCILR